MQFRKDINGLRAIAVLAVILFHFKPNWVPGGFVGVDIFFVISGFLMTGIIFSQLAKNQFSITAFYLARANRIIPALAFLCLVLLGLGWFYLSPDDYADLGKHAASSTVFVSNFVYWGEAGYFAAVAHEKWLLHTWSLSVEWQFYIAYPVILVLLSKILPLRILKIVILLAAVLGFVFCIIATGKWFVAAYYLLPMRAWEMLVGGIAFLYPLQSTNRVKKVAGWAGISLVLISCFVISKNVSWPGYMAALPVIGSFLLLQSQQANSLITGNIVFQKIGLWSYSIYLWHWPLVVAIHYFSLPDIWVYPAMLTSIGLGFASYRTIEQIRFEKNLVTVAQWLKCKPIYMAIIIGILAYSIFALEGISKNIRLTSVQQQIVAQTKRNPKWAKCGKVINGISPECKYGNGPLGAIVIGDSHAQAQILAIAKSAQRHQKSILDWSFSACETIVDLYKTTPNGKVQSKSCGQLVRNAINTAKTKYPDVPVIVINRLAYILHGNAKGQPIKPPVKFVDQVFTDKSDPYRANIIGHSHATICAFSKTNPVYLQRPIPEFSVDIAKNLYRSTLPAIKLSLPKLSIGDYYKRQAQVMKLQDNLMSECGVKIIDPLPLLCPEKYCQGTLNGNLLYFDDNHLSLFGAEHIANTWDQVFEAP